jgi:hypothetical protein
MLWLGPLAIIVLASAGCGVGPSPDTGADVDASATEAPPNADQADTTTSTGPTTSTTAASATSSTTTTSTTTASTSPPTTPTTPTTSPAAVPERLAGEPEVGVQFHATWSNYSASDRVAILDKMKAAGMQWVRIDLGWASYEYHGPGQIESWYVQRADAAVNEARARGFKVLATLWQTPAWANGGAGTTAPPSNPGDYARFARWVADHFKGRVAAWEVWNEPNLSEYYSGTAASYASLLKAAYPELKAGDPAAKVVLGGPAYNDDAYIAALYANGIKGSFDVMSTHPYQGFADAAPETPDDGTRGTFSHVASVRNLMVANGDGGKELWFTEFGWSSHATPAGAPNWRWGVTESQQADYFMRSLRWIAQNAPYVTKVFWYNERNQVSGDYHLDNYGLLRADLSEKPAYQTIRDYLT